MAEIMSSDATGEPQPEGFDELIRVTSEKMITQQSLTEDPQEIEGEA